MTDKTETPKQETTAETAWTNPVQSMAYDTYRIYKQFWDKQQQAYLQYLTQVIQNIYNPWK